MNKSDLEHIEWRLRREVDKYRHADWMDDETFVSNILAKLIVSSRE